jgi:phosphonoacetaldehyde hydrolase
MQHVLPVAAQGFCRDNLVCSDDLAEGRPGPLVVYKCMIGLAVFPPGTLLEIDDTATGIAQGASAGCVTVGLALSGNAVGKTLEELAMMSDSEIATLRDHATQLPKDAGADHVIDTIRDLPELVTQLSLIALVCEPVVDGFEGVSPWIVRLSFSRMVAVVGVDVVADRKR